MAPASGDALRGPGPQPTKEATVDKVKDTGTRSRIKDRPDKRDRRNKREGDRLFDVLAALPFEERIEAIERMAERMGV